MSGERTIAYTRRSTDRQDTSHDVQLARIVAAEGPEVVHVQDTASGSVPLEDRPGGRYALELLASGECDRLVVSKLDRVARSVAGFATLLERAQRDGWELACLDPALDLGTANGRMVANVLAAVAEWERDTLRERTREGLAIARQRGAQVGGPRVADDVARRIARERGEGRSLRAIADALTADGVATARGAACWHASTVRSVLRWATPAAA